MRCQRASTTFGSYSGSMRQVYEDVGEFFHAVRVFFDELTGVAWGAIAIALGFHLVKLLLRSIAYRNILRASYPAERIRFWPVAGAYILHVSVNSIVANPHDNLIKLYMIIHLYPTTTY